MVAPQKGKPGRCFLLDSPINIHPYNYSRIVCTDDSSHSGKLRGFLGPFEGAFINLLWFPAVPLLLQAILGRQLAEL